jgi:rod shape-determining protein MreC
VGDLGGGGVSLGARFVLLAALAIGLMLADHQSDRLRRLHEFLSVAVYPIQVIVDLPFSTWDALSESVADRGSLRDENERLARELRVAKVRLQGMQTLERENADLRELVDAVEMRRELDIRLAEILSVDLENRQRFIINRGKNDGVYDCQPLLDADGVVGQVIEASARTARALLITDASHSIHVANVRTQQRTIAQGTGDSRGLRLMFVTNEDDFRVGDQLVTTGFGGIFPPGRPVATITSVEPQPGQSWAEVHAEPVAALDRIQEVLLVWDGTDDSVGCAANPVQNLAGLIP